jgi:hypothetical protein
MVWEFWIKVTRKWQSGASFGVIGRSVKGGGVRRRGSEEGFGGGEEGCKAVRCQLLVLMVEVSKEEGFRGGVWRRRGRL